MDPQVAFYKLDRKVVNNRESIPEDARQVIYYSLAIGHHVGVMDCFSELMAVSSEEFKNCLSRMPEGEARRKLEGVLEWEEIEINRSHVDELLPALNMIISGNGETNHQWVNTLIRCLREMITEPAFYLMVRMRS